MKLPFEQIFSLLHPAQVIIAKILPGFVEKDLKDPKVRELIVLAADKALTTQEPWAAALPASVRQKILAGVLSTVLDNAVLP